MNSVSHQQRMMEIQHMSNACLVTLLPRVHETLQGAIKDGSVLKNTQNKHLIGFFLFFTSKRFNLFFSLPVILRLTHQMVVVCLRCLQGEERRLEALVCHLSHSLHQQHHRSPSHRGAQSNQLLAFHTSTFTWQKCFRYLKVV